MEEVWIALLLTSIAGLSTTIGAVLGVVNRKPSPRFVSFILAISGGVMIFLSFVEMFIPAWQVEGEAYALIFLGVGLAIGFVFDIILPEEKNVHEHMFNGTLVEEGKPGAGRRFHKRGKHHHPRFRRKNRMNNPQCKQMYCIDEEKFMKIRGSFHPIQIVAEFFSFPLSTFPLPAVQGSSTSLATSRPLSVKNILSILAAIFSGSMGFFFCISSEFSTRSAS